MTDCYLLSSVKGQILSASRKGLRGYETNGKIDEWTWRNMRAREDMCAAGFCQESVSVKIKNVPHRAILIVVYHCAVSKEAVYVKLRGSVFTVLVENKIIDPKMLVKSADAGYYLPKA